MILVLYFLCYYVTTTKLWHNHQFQDTRPSIAGLTLVTALNLL